MVEMKKISFKTKIEAAVIISLLISLSIASVFAVTRTISDTQDTVDTYIRNSNGKYWSVSEANIQAAIDDLGANGYQNGVVTVAGNKTIAIYTGLVLKKYMTLDLQGSYLHVLADVDAVTMGEGSVLQGGTIDVRDYAGTYTHAAVAFNPVTIGHNYWTGNTRVQNMFLLGTTGEGAAIQYQLAVQGNIVAFTTCSDIYTHGFKYAILINVTGGNETGAVTYANANQFKNIHIIYPTFGIYLHRNSSISNHNQCSCDGNQFDNIQLEPDTTSVNAIYSEGRYNIFDNIFVWDWGVAAGTYAYEFPTDSQYCFLSYFGGDVGLQSGNDYISNGTDNYRVNMRTGAYSMETFNQASEPDISTDTMAFWHNTSSGKYYLIKDFGGTQKKTELT